MKNDHAKFVEALKGLRYIVINKCYGGFGLSAQGIAEYKRLAGITDPKWYDGDILRDDPHLVQVVKKLGHEANGAHADLKIVEIPSDVDWQIDEYDGIEWVAEVHRTWE